MYAMTESEFFARGKTYKNARETKGMWESSISREPVWHVWIGLDYVDRIGKDMSR